MKTISVLLYFVFASSLSAFAQTNIKISQNDSLSIIQSNLDSLNDHMMRVNDSLLRYYTFNGKAISFTKSTFETFLALNESELYFIDKEYIDKHKSKNGEFKLGSRLVYMYPGGSINDNYYFGVNNVDQTFTLIEFNNGLSRCWDKKCTIHVTSYTNEDKSDFIVKVNKQISNSSNFHILSETERKEWLLKTTNLDDGFFVLREDSILTSKELLRVNNLKVEFLTRHKDLKINDVKSKDLQTQVAAQETKKDIAFSKEPSSSLVKIGNNYWQNQNCRITKYINGDPIFYAKNVQELSAANKRKEGAYCFINFNSKLDSSYIVYNWYAIMDPRGFGTKELRVPNWADWKNLISTLEKDGKTHNDLKKVEDWDKNTNYPASNFYGFNGTPTFYGYPDGYYVQENFRKTNGMYFWIPNDNVGSYFKLEDGKAYQAGFTNDGSKIYYTQEFKNSMFPMRLVKGETSYFDGNVVSGQKQGQGTLYVRNDDIYRYDYVNYINVEIGSKIEGNWVDNQLEGRAKITWYDGASEDALFSKNHHEGALKVIQNTTQKCLYDGKIFNSHYKKTSAEIEDEKSTTQNITIRAYKTEYYCSTICEKKAQEEMLKRQQEAREREIQRSREQANNSGPKWQCGSCMMLSFQNYEPSRQGCINSGQHFWWEVDSSHPLWECSTCHKVSYKDSEPPNYLKDCSGYDGRHYWVKVNRN